LLHLENQVIDGFKRFRWKKLSLGRDSKKHFIIIVKDISLSLNTRKFFYGNFLAPKTSESFCAHQKSFDFWSRKNHLKIFPVVNDELGNTKVVDYSVKLF